MSEKIVNVDITEQSRKDLQAYAIYVARRRAIPDSIDGLKPVVRKILWCAGHDHRGESTKTARMTGDVIGKYNPHGDTSVQSAIRNMINDFSTKYPTMEGIGSWGTKVNPVEAAARYTDCKISKFATDVFMRDIYEYGKTATDWMLTYNNTEYEPIYLPARIPIMLINGQVGIGVGIKVSIPSHNLGDVIDATIALMKNPKANFCLVPDECMSCELIDTDWQKINDTGIGSYIAQGIIEIGEYDHHPALYIRSLPDFTYFDSIQENITKIVASGKMPYILDIISKTKTNERTGITKFEEVVILKKGTDPGFVKEFLYANTGIRQTRQVRILVINRENKLQQMNYREYLLDFIQFRREHLFRLLNSNLQKYQTAIHERELYLKVMTSGKIDKIIDKIRNQDTTDNSKLVEFLCKELRVTDLQAKFLLNTNISKLSKGYLKQYQRELKDLTEKSDRIISILTDPKKKDKLIAEDMIKIKEKYNTKHLCKIITKSQASGIAPGTFKLVFTKNNFIKKISENEVPSVVGNDSINFVLKVENEEDIIVFNELGKVFRLPVHKIPLATKGSNGVDIRVLNKYSTANICCAARATILEKLTKSKLHNYIFVVSRNGYIKKIDIEDILTAPPSGIIYSKLDEGDKVVDILFGPDKLDLLVYSNFKVLRISPKEVPYLKRSTKGNRVSTASTLIDGMTFITPQDTCLLVVTKKGYINKIPLSIIQRSNRGRACNRVIKLNKDDEVLTFLIANEQSELLVYESKKTYKISVDSIKNSSTVSTGVKILKYNPMRVVVL